MLGTIHEILNDNLVTVPLGDGHTVKVIRQEDLSKVAQQVAKAVYTSAEWGGSQGRISKTESKGSSEYRLTGLPALLVYILVIFLILNLAKAFFAGG